MFSIFFFFILILKRSISFTTIHFLYSLHFSYSKHVHCFRQANLVEIYLIMFDAVVGKLEIFHSVGTKRALDVILCDSDYGYRVLFTVACCLSTR